MRFWSLMILAAMSLSACSNIGNMFSGSGPERPFDTTQAPDTDRVLKGKPEGLVADTQNANHTGLPLQPQ